MRSSALITLAAPALILGTACTDSSSPNMAPMSISFSSQAAAAPSPALGDVIVTSGTNTLVITKAQIVVRRIKLTESTATLCSDDDANTDDCEETVSGPILVDLPLTTTTVQSVAASIPAGTYSEIEFKIHKPGGDTGDAAFGAANPNFANSSIRVEGTFNGTAFVFTSTLSETQRLTFDPPIVLDETNKNVTIQFDVSSWFKNGTTVVNPATANPGGANENLVRDNIRRSLRAIEDDDKNGH
jgi:hypothetical protein